MKIVLKMLPNAGDKKTNKVTKDWASLGLKEVPKGYNLDKSTKAGWQAVVKKIKVIVLNAESKHYLLTREEKAVLEKFYNEVENI